jgi:hypothetical protein
MHAKTQAPADGVQGGLKEPPSEVGLVARRLVFVVALFAGLAGGTAWASGHTAGGVYHGPHFESRNGPDYHHCWTEHGHGNKAAGCSYYNGSGNVFFCGTGIINAVHAHCTGYREGRSNGWHLTGSNTTRECVGENAWPTYLDEHGICTHFRHE